MLKQALIGSTKPRSNSLQMLKKNILSLSIFCIIHQIVSPCLPLIITLTSKSNIPYHDFFTVAGSSRIRCLHIEIPDFYLNYRVYAPQNQHGAIININGMEDKFFMRHQNSAMHKPYQSPFLYKIFVTIKRFSSAMPSLRVKFFLSEPFLFFYINILFFRNRFNYICNILCLIL